ncbi:PREDICTED: uncharacterized protein LOC105462797 [Wasmannia auropunctata]|uniref:uncharacterized protein LOC105462797 n=1 Tax=Wasmannia auropunctata TaxID=64793 RepID=UPI0005EEE9E7|nr:PREDICTED: uncharacterized protein LOC105462797 [Wasmannia auropunctata]
MRYPVWRLDRARNMEQTLPTTSTHTMEPTMSTMSYISHTVSHIPSEIQLPNPTTNAVANFVNDNYNGNECMNFATNYRNNEMRDAEQQQSQNNINIRDGMSTINKQLDDVKTILKDGMNTIIKQLDDVKTTQNTCDWCCRMYWLRTARRLAASKYEDKFFWTLARARTPPGSPREDPQMNSRGVEASDDGGARVSSQEDSPQAPASPCEEAPLRVILDVASDTRTVCFYNKCEWQRAGAVEWA